MPTQQKQRQCVHIMSRNTLPCTTLFDDHHDHCQGESLASVFVCTEPLSAYTSHHHPARLQLVGGLGGQGKFEAPIDTLTILFGDFVSLMSS